MSGRTFRVSPWQLAVLVFLLSLCVTPFGFPGLIERQLGRASWMAAVPALAVAIWGTAIAVDLAHRHPGRPFEDIVLDGFGPYLGYPYLVVLGLVLLAGVPVNMHVFVSVAGTTQLTRMPPIYPAVLVAAAATYAAYFGPEVIGRCAEALAPFIGIGLLAIYLVPAINADPARLLPLHVPLGQLASPPALAAASTCRGFVVLLLLGPFSRPLPRSAPMMASATVAWILIVASLALPISLFGAPFARTLRFPFLTALGTIGWRWLPIQRLLVATMLVWHGVAFVVFATYLWLGAWLLRRVLPFLPWPVLVVGLGMAAIAAALQLPSGLRLAIVDAWNYAVIVLGVLVPSLLWLLAGRQRHGEPVAARESTPA